MAPHDPPPITLPGQLGQLEQPGERTAPAGPPGQGAEPDGQVSRRRFLGAGALGAVTTALGAARLVWGNAYAQEVTPPAGSTAGPAAADPGGPAAPAAPDTTAANSL